MSATWTPGPWFTDGRRSQAWFDGHGRRHEAGAIGIFADAGIACVAVTVPGCLPAVGAEDAARANSYLVAAAPDLAEALEPFSREAEALLALGLTLNDETPVVLSVPSSALRKALLALSKARGETE